MIFRNHVNYTVQAGSGGAVHGTDTAGKIYIEPDFGKYGTVSGANYINENASISSSATVTFSDNFVINTLTASKTATGVTASVGFTAKNVKNEVSPALYIALLDDNGAVIDAKLVKTNSSLTSTSVDLLGTLEEGKSYMVKAMIWNSAIEPMTNYKTIQL